MPGHWGQVGASGTQTMRVQRNGARALEVVRAAPGGWVQARQCTVACMVHTIEPTISRLATRAHRRRVQISAIRSSQKISRRTEGQHSRAAVRTTHPRFNTRIRTRWC